MKTDLITSCMKEADREEKLRESELITLFSANKLNIKR
jgi:hypothetical protein